MSQQAQKIISGNLPSDAQMSHLGLLQARQPLLLQYHINLGAGEPQPRQAIVLANAIQASGGHIISRAPLDLLAIGDNPALMDEIWLVRFPGVAEVSAHVAEPKTRALFDALPRLEILVSEMPSPRMQRIVKWMNRLLRLLPAHRAGERMPEEELQGGINPTKAQFAAFGQADQTVPVHMFNLLKFHPRARYADGDRGRSGRRAYEDGYGRVAMECVLRLKGRIIMLGRYHMTLVGAQGDPALDAWNEIAVIQYPNRPAFVQMVSTPKYIRALEHRHAGLARTEVWSTAPTMEYCQ